MGKSRTRTRYAALSRRFRFVREIGAGGGGTVYLVEDRISAPATKALKIVPAGGDARTTQLRREFDVLRRLRHPGLVPVYDFGETSGALWFSSEFVPGPDIFEASAGWSLGDLERAFQTLLETLQFLHERGLVHNDLKASNTRVPAGPASVRLLDFGLASALTGGPLTGGTPPYMAPERLSRPGSLGSVSADLYALGVVVYRCATRRLPFEGDNPKTLLPAIHAGPVPPRALRPEIPPYLEAMLTRMLDPDPGRRPRGATDLLAELASHRPEPARGGDSIVTLPTAPLLDREEMLADLGGAWERAREGDAQWLLLTGEAGIGKSRLLTELKQRLELGGAVVAEISVEPGALRPWALLTQILRHLSVLVHAPAPPPGLDKIVGPGSASGGGVPGIDVREIFARYLTDCARVTPVAILIDDFGWGDAESVRAVAGLPDQPRRDLGLLLCATARDDPDAAGHPVRCDAPPWRILPVPALSQVAQRAALISLFPGGEVSEPLLSDALAQAAGNPLALAEIARLWVETGAVKRVGGRWTAAPGVARATGGKPREIIAARLRALPEEAAVVVRFVALHGRPLPADLLARLVPDAPAIVHRLVRGGLLAEGPSGIDVKHPLVRETAVERASAREVMASHAQLAAAFEAAGAPPDDVWRHLLRGGEPARGLPLALAAGLRAAEMEDFPTGRAILEEAARATETAPGALAAADRVRLTTELASCLAETGAAEEAIGLLERAIENADARTRARVAARLVTVLRHTGDTTRAEKLLGEARPISGDRLLEAEIALGWALAHGERKRFDAARKALEPVIDRAGDLEQDPRGVKLLLDGYMIAHAVAANEAGPKNPAVYRYLEAGRSLAERRGLVGHAAYMRVMQATVMAFSGRLDEALKGLREIEAAVEAGGNATSWTLMRRSQAYALHYSGRSAVAVEQLRAIQERGNPRARANTAGALAEALADACDPAALELSGRITAGILDGATSDFSDAGLSAAACTALWLGRKNDGEALGTALARRLQEASPSELPEVAFIQGIVALIHGDAVEAAARLREALERAATFAPLNLGRIAFHLAYAQALGGHMEEAARAANDAERAWADLGNTIEAARARCLRAAVEGGRIGSGGSTLDWQARLVAVMADLPAAGDPAGLLCGAVVRSVDATAAWLAVGSPDEPTVAVRAGPCAAAEPIAWAAEIRAAIGERKSASRAGIGVVLPLTHDGAPAALVIEDRAFPGAFQAPLAAQLVADRVQAEIDRRQLRADLDAARRALDRASRTPPRVGTTVTTISSRRRSIVGKDLLTLLDLSLGPVELRHSFDAIVGRSTQMRRALQLLDRVVDMEANVIVVGETGTGKELVARAIHEQGPRAAGPFVAVNCSAIPPALAESEFFGHQPGAFTGASRTKHRGYFEQASGGTLFLDEIGELDPALQAKLLRALEEGEIRPVGAERPVPVDVRVVSATNRDLRQEAAAGRFRSDLYFRLAVVELKLPPLRERADDIPALARHLLATLHDPPPSLSPDALDAIGAYSWPGNVRQLRNELERAVAFAGSGRIELQHLSPSLRSALEHNAPPARTLREAMDAFERRMILETLRACGGNRTETARKLGLSRVGFYNKINKHQRAGKFPRLGGRRRTIGTPF